MQGVILALALTSICMSAAAQVLFKVGMSGAAVRAALADGAALGVIRAVALNPGIVGGLALYGLGTVLWLGVLSRAELSQAYPFVGLSFGNRGKTTDTAAFFSCADSASWTLCIMCRRHLAFPR